MDCAAPGPKKAGSAICKDRAACHQGAFLIGFAGMGWVMPLVVGSHGRCAADGNDQL